MKIAVTGARGMLGRAVLGTVTAYGHEPVAVSARIEDYVMLARELAGDYPPAPSERAPDVLINCAGVRGTSEAVAGTLDHERMAMSNTVGPHVLARLCYAAKIRLIHVSTDCVFETERPIPHEEGPPPGRGEATPVSPKTLYGLTKAAGEPRGMPLVTVVRTSFVGVEHGLLGDMIAVSNQPRAASAPKRQYPAWLNAWWSGSSVYEVARKLVELAMLRPYTAARFPLHFATLTPVRKSDVVRLIIERAGLPLDPTMKGEPHIDRSLAPSPGWELRPFADTLDDLLPLIRSRLK